MAKRQIRLQVIPEPDPETRIIFYHGRPNNLAVGGTNRSAPDLCCGGCGALLVTGIEETSVEDIVFRCQACGAFNDLH